MIGQICRRTESEPLDLPEPRAACCFTQPRCGSPNSGRTTALLITARPNSPAVFWVDYDATLPACAGAWNWFAADPDRIRSIGTREWATVNF
jgi:hypothetical protein